MIVSDAMLTKCAFNIHDVDLPVVYLTRLSTSRYGCLSITATAIHIPGL